MKAASPTLPTGSIATVVGENQLASTDDQPVKWSSPSSVDSNGQKTDSSAGNFANPDQRVGSGEQF